jgi:hypothetical protein
MNKLLRNPDVETKMLPDGHVVLFSPQTDWAHTLSPLGGIAWEFCDGENTVDEIIELVANTVEVNSKEVSGELKTLCDELVESGLLTSDIK